MRWYQIDDGFACGAIRVSAAGNIDRAAPIFKKFLGKSFVAVLAENKNITYRELKENIDLMGGW